MYVVNEPPIHMLCLCLPLRPIVEKRTLDNEDDVSFSAKKTKMESILDDIK